MMNLESCIELLTRHGIDVALYGTGKAKTIAHLVKEVNEGECTLISSDKGLVRELNVVSAMVYYETLVLKETKQVFADGREKVRTKDSSVSEKLQPGEDPWEGLKRGITEELAIQGELDIVQLDTEVVERESDSFPGLLGRYNLYKFNVYLTPEQYQPEGYMEIQSDKVTYFGWE